MGAAPFVVDCASNVGDARICETLFTCGVGAFVWEHLDVCRGSKLHPVRDGHYEKAAIYLLIYGSFMSILILNS